MVLSATPWALLVLGAVAVVLLGALVVSLGVSLRKANANLGALTRRARVVEEVFDEFDADTAAGVGERPRVELRNCVAEMRYVLNEQRRGGPQR